MGINEGSLQVIDIELILENWPIVLLYGTYLPVALVVLFVVHTVCVFLCFLPIYSGHKLR